jgi:hypothetical protein
MILKVKIDSAPSPNAVAPIAQPGVVNTFNGTPQMVASYRIAVAPDGQPLPPIKIVVASSVMNGSRPRDPNMCPIDDEPHEEDLNRRWLMCCLGVVWYIHNKKCVKCGLDML